MKKRIFVLLLALVLVLSVVPVHADAASGGTWGKNLEWSLEGGVLTITGSGEMEDAWLGLYDIPEVPWAELDVEAVIIVEGVTSVGDNCFYGLEGLKSVTLPGSVRTIGESAFERCDDLETVTLAEGLAEIGYCAFWDSGLKAVTIPASVTEIGPGAFCWCDRLEAFRVAEGNGDFAADAQGVLYRAGFETIVQVPGAYAGELVIPDTITAMDDDYILAGCDDVTCIRIPASVETMTSCIFANCTALEAIEVDDENPDFYDIDGVLYGPLWDYDENGDDALLPALIACPARYAAEDFHVPENVQLVSCCSFNNCSELENIHISASTPYIYRDVFYGCTGLQGIWFAEGHPYYISDSEGVVYNTAYTIEEFDIESFQFVTVEIPAMSELYFYPAGRGGYYAIPEGVTHIFYGAFSFSAVEAIRFPGTLEYLEEYALDSCAALEWMLFTGDKPYCEASCLEGVTADVYYPDYLSSWEEWEEGYFVGPDLGEDCAPWGELTYIPYGEGQAPVWPGLRTENPFTDVPDGEWYAEPVVWALENGITTGTTDTTFDPNGQCLRAHVVTFLWRAEGCPEPTSGDNPFVDVKETDFFYKAVLWAVENGITNGTDATHFGPYGVCNRASVVTFLWRAVGEPEPTAAETAFADVPAGSWYDAPVRWAVENGITNGLSATAFGPDSPCNRAQVVTFLYRAFGE